MFRSPETQRVKPFVSCAYLWMMWEPGALCSSSVTLGPAHLTSNTQKQIPQPAPPAMASHLVAHHLFLSGCDATFTATLDSWCLHSLTFFPLPLLSPYGHSFSKPPSWEIWGTIITLPILSLHFLSHVLPCQMTFWFSTNSAFWG